MSLFGPPDIKKLEEKKDLKRLVKALNHKKDWVGLSAAEALSRISDPKTLKHLLPFLIKELSSPIPGAHIDMAKNALTKIGAPAIEPLQELYRATCQAHKNKRADDICKDIIKILACIVDNKNESIFWREAALVSVAKLGGTGAHDTVISAIYDPSFQNKEEMDCLITAAASIGRSFVQPLTSIIINKPKELRIRMVIAESLAKLQYPEAVEGLTICLTDYQIELTTRKKVADALELLNWEPGQNEISAAFWVVRGNIDACKEIGLPAFKPLFSLLGHFTEDPGVGVEKHIGPVFGAIREIGPQAVDYLIEAIMNYRNSYQQGSFSGRDEQTMVNAIRLLGEFKNKKATSLLMQFVDKTVDPLYVTGTSRGYAAEALGEIGDDRAVDLLIQHLRGEQFFESNNIMIALGKIGDKRAVPELVKKLSLQGESLSHFRVKEKCAVAKALSMFNWQPEENETGVLFHFFSFDLDKCIQMGKSAIKPISSILERFSVDTLGCRKATKVLAEIGGEEVIEPLINSFELLSEETTGTSSNAKWHAETSEALKKITGLNYDGRFEWRDWWKKTKSREKC